MLNENIASLISQSWEYLAPVHFTSVGMVLEWQKYSSHDEERKVNMLCDTADEIKEEREAAQGETTVEEG